MPEHDRYIVIRASAGSGKTYQLSGRYLSLLRGGVEPSHILATTFTRKAAGEILGRVLTRLGRAARSDAKADELAKALGDPSLDRAAARDMLTTLARSLHRVGVSTIDAQMHRMAMCYRFELGLPAAPRLVAGDSAVAAQLRRRAIDALLADDTPDVLIPLLRRLEYDQARRRISDTLDDLFTKLYSLFRQTSAAAWHAVPMPDTLLDHDMVETAIGLLREAGALLPGDKRFAKAWTGDIDNAATRDWQVFLSSGLAKAIASGTMTYYKKDIPDELAKAYRPLVVHAQASIVAQVVDRTRAMYELTARFDKHYTALRRAHGIVLFDDLPVMLGGVFSGDQGPDLQTLYFRMDTSVGHLLLDEFQDTSPIQWRVLRPFAQEIRSTDEGGRTFFCVGDIKQAIYGWRGACAAIFDRVIDDLSLPPQSLQTMDTSFRSSQVVLDVVNRVFGHIADCPPLEKLYEPVAAWAAGFSDHTAHFDQLSGYVELAATPAPAEPDDPPDRGDDEHDDDESPPTSSDLAHLNAVADRVAALAAAHPARSIGVLVRRNKIAATLLGLLRDRGVEASGEGGAALHNDTAVQLMLSALHLADHPGDTAAAYHVLHSPLASAVGLESMDEAARTAASRLIRRQLLDHGYAELLVRWARAIRASLGPRGVERVTQLIALAEQHDPLRPLRTGQFIEFVEGSLVEDPTPARVRVMTVHKAKGLEFDVVVLGELENLIGQVKALVWQGGQDPTEQPDLLIAHTKSALRPTLFEYAPAVEQAFNREVAARVADDLSSFYVAMTRPRRALHLLVKPPARTTRGWSSRGLTNAAPASVLRFALGGFADDEGREPRMGTEPLFEHGDRDWDKQATAKPDEPPAVAPRPVLRLRADTGEQRWWRAVSPSTQEDGGKVSVSRLLDAGARESRRYGTRVHQMLEQVAYWSADMPAPDAELAAILEHPAVRQALSPVYQGEGLWREQPFALRIDGDLVRGVFDRVAIDYDAQGRPTAATLTDFKTDAFSDEAVARYQPQLALYRQALARMLGIDVLAVQARLLFVREGRIASIA